MQIESTTQIKFGYIPKTEYCFVLKVSWNVIQAVDIRRTRQVKLFCIIFFTTTNIIKSGQLSKEENLHCK
jgi:hypothetical protein